MRLSPAYQRADHKPICGRSLHVVLSWHLFVYFERRAENFRVPARFFARFFRSKEGADSDDKSLKAHEFPFLNSTQNLAKNSFALSFSQIK